MKNSRKNPYQTYNHAKTSLRYHIIFSTKYRGNCLNDIKDVVYKAFLYAESISNFKILKMGIDNNHIHFLITWKPRYSISQVVHRLKQISSHYVWDNCPKHLRKFFWKKEKRLLWTRGYFCSSIGEVSDEKIYDYIRNQE